MKKIRFSADWFETGPTGNSYARFEAGKDYPADDAEAMRCVARGIAAEVDVDEDLAAEPAAEVAPAETAAAPTGAQKKK